jgi:hypothetical protein
MAQIVGCEHPHAVGCLNLPAAGKQGLIRLNDGKIVLFSEPRKNGSGVL